MAPQAPLVEKERENFDFFLTLPDPDRSKLKTNVKLSQFARPLMEFSGACVGCGETPYLKLMTQLYGDRAMVANATGCSSIFGGNLPTTPYTTDGCGRGPAWANSLFEDNAEFGMGFRLAIDKHRDLAIVMVKALADQIGGTLADELVIHAKDREEEGVIAQRLRVDALKEKLTPWARRKRHSCSRLPTIWSTRAFGSPAATAGPTTSATAVSTTCWRPAKTSTSWSWTPRCTQTPAASSRKPPPSAQRPSSPS